MKYNLSYAGIDFRRCRWRWNSFDSGDRIDCHVFAGMMLASDENDTEILPVSEEVKAYEPIIQKYTKEHGIPDYVLLIEAVMMLESGGRGTDPMVSVKATSENRLPAGSKRACRSVNPLHL